MSNNIPTEIDPFLCADQNRRYELAFKADDFSRILDDLKDGSQPINAELEFSRDGKIIKLMGRIYGHLMLQCNACLEDIDFPVDIDVNLAIIRDEAMVELLDDDVDPCLLDEDNLSLKQVVEDELVIVMPYVARHDQCPTELPTTSKTDDFTLETDDKPNPFEALKDLKKH